MITDDLKKLSDCNYKEFQGNLIPNIDSKTVLGVRTPILRKYASKLSDEEKKEFLHHLPHTYYDENILHGILLSQITDYEVFIEEINTFLPYIDNWAVCDIIKPKVVMNHSKEFIREVKTWIKSSEIYTIRFGIDMLMTYYLDDQYRKTYLTYPLKVKSNDYYVNMAVAWFYATALAKRWDDTILILEEKRLPKWTHNKTIQKALESYRITSSQKDDLKSLRLK